MVFFHGVSDSDTQVAYARIAAHVAEKASKMNSGALDEFLSGADPWLIAKALCTGATIVTHEKLNMDIKRKFLILNACVAFGVPCMNTFGFLSKLKARFVLPG